MADSILDVDIQINGGVKLIISSDSDLGRELLKGKFTKIEVTTEVMKTVDKTIPAGSLVIS